MSKFGFNPDDFRPPARAGSKLEEVIESAMRDSGATDTTLDYALRYISLGWYILPVRIDKKPVDGYGLNHATNDPDEARRIWTENPTAGIAVACEKSGLVVVDIDPRNDGRATIHKFEEEHGRLYSAVAAQTQGGGEHRFFKAEPGSGYPGTLGFGVDLKHKGYVLVEPSHGTEGVYRWLPERDPTRGSVPTDAPETLHARRSSEVETLNTYAPSSIVVAPQVYDELAAALKVLPADLPYSDWFAVLQGLSRLADKHRAYDIALEWSMRSSKKGHTEAAFKDKWRTCMRENYAVSYQTVFYKADTQDRSWRNSTQVATRAAHTLESFVLAPLSIDELGQANLHPRIILHHMLYADVRTRISAGGVGKTTLAMFEAVTLALGRELWGRTPEQPVRTVVVTREDTREILVARMREIMKTMQLDPDSVKQVLSNINIVDLSGVSYRISEVSGDVVQPHADNLDWLCKLLKDFKPDWLIMDPMVSFGVGEQRVNDAEQGLIEAMRIIKAEFNCCVEGIHHSGKANAREKTLDQYSGRGGSALSDGSRMVCVMQPLTPQEWLDATGTYLEDSESGIVMAMPKMSYCRAQDPVYVKRTGYSFQHVQPLVAPTATETQKQNDGAVYQVLKDAWFKNQPLTMQGLKDDYKALFYNNLKRDAVIEAVGRLKRDGHIIQNESKGGRGQRATLEPVIVNAEEVSKYSIPGEPGETRRD